ncbi:MAG: hypothetical protein PHR06_13290 [Candidatus Cloacimonetes bacterium]|nr:hypothetical protein [Candidatus Cloacimonadota bacterium]
MIQIKANQDYQINEAQGEVHEIIGIVYNQFYDYLIEQAKILQHSITEKKKIGSYDEAVFLKIQLGIITGSVISQLQAVYKIHQTDKLAVHCRSKLRKGQKLDDWAVFKTTFIDVLQKMATRWEKELHSHPEEQYPFEFCKTTHKLSIIRKLSDKFVQLCQTQEEKKMESCHGVK